MKATIRADQLQSGDRFTYVGAFAHYWVEKAPRHDPTFPGRVLIEALRNGAQPNADGTYPRVFLTIRLRADQDVEAS